MIKRLLASLMFLLIPVSLLWAQDAGTSAEASEGEETVVGLEETLKIKAGAPAEKRTINEQLRDEPFIYKSPVERDPFKTPLTEKAKLTQPVVPKRRKIGKPVKGGPKGKGVPAQQLSLEQQTEILEGLADVKKQIDDAISAKKIDEKLVLGLNDQFGRRLETVDPKITDPNMRRRLRSLVQDHENIRPRLIKIMVKHFAGDIERKATVIRKEFELENYQSVITLAGELADYLEKNKDLLETDPDVGAKVLKTMSGVAALSRKADVRMEFAKKTFVINGINWSPEMAMAIMNEKIDVSIGTEVDGAKVVKITKTSVVLDFKGELFEVPFFD